MKTPPVHPVLSGGTFGLMSGEKPFFPAKIEANHENLINTLRAMGLKHEQTHGRYGDPERSVIIHNPREDQMKTLGKLFGQESVIHSSGGRHRLIYTNGPDEGKYRGTMTAQPPHQWFDAPPEDYYTHLPGAGHFRINFDFDQEPQGANANIKQEAPSAPVPMGKSIFQRLNLKKSLPKTPAENQSNQAGFLNQPPAIDAGLESGALKNPGVEVPSDATLGPAHKSVYPKGVMDASADRAQHGIYDAVGANTDQNAALGWAAKTTVTEPASVWNKQWSGEPADRLKEKMFWAHPNFYEWHDGHTDHHNPRPWDKQTAMDTARSLGLIKAVQGDPSFDKQFNVFHEADHGSYRMSGGLHNRLQNTQSINLTYTSKQRSLIPGRSGRPVSLGTFANKQDAYAAQLAHHDRVAAGLHKSLAKAVNDQAAGVGVSTYAKFAGPYGSLTPGKPSNLMHYDYNNKLPAIQELVKKHGFQVYYAGGKYGKPDLANKNYNTNHLMIYDPTPQSGGDFGQHDYTNAWRQIHELAHALTYPELNNTYGEGRRIGKLGTHRTMNEAMRAVHWEHLAAHKQRELSKQIGIHVPDDVFHKEYNTVMHDAVHRAVTGQFTEPASEGFTPHSHPIPLSHALDMVRHEGKKMGLQHQHDLAPKRQ